MSGLNSILLEIAEASVREKRAFVPMPGGMPDPSMGGGMPMDPSMMGGGMPMDPSMAGGAVPPMDPMAMAAQGADPAAIMAASGAPVDPMVAAAGGAAGVPAPAAPAPAEVAPASSGGKGGKKDKIDEIYTMLTKVIGVLVGKGLLAPTELGDVGLGQASEQGAAAPDKSGVPSEQKVAEAPALMGSVVEDVAVELPTQKVAGVKNALADLILALSGE